jgi:predicted Zn-dependent protease
MNINRPDQIYRVHPNNYNLTEIKVRRNTDTSNTSEVKEKKKLPEDLIQCIKQWENSDQTEKKKGARWDLSIMPLKYYVHKGMFISGYLKEFEEVINTVTLDWSRASLGKIRFIKTLSEQEADIVIRWADTVIIGRDYESGHNNLKVVGERIEKAEISIVLYPAIDKLLPASKRIERVRRTLLHEFGHALGLHHSETAKDIMHHRGISNRSISENDMQRLQDLYNSPPVNEFSI